MTELASYRTDSRFAPALRHLTAFGIGVLYAVLVMYLPIEQAKDFHNYLSYAAQGFEPLANLWESHRDTIIVSEPLWLLINAVLGEFLSPEVLVRTIICAAAFSTAYIVALRYPRHLFWIAVVLLTPQVMKKFTIHLRQGLAVSIFMLGWSLAGRWPRLALWALTPLIHVSFGRVLAVLVIWWAIRWYCSARITILLQCAVSLIIALSLESLATLVGARQSELFSSMEVSVSGFGFVFWGAMLALLFTANTRVIDRYAAGIAILSLYVASYWNFVGAARLLENGLILILLAGTELGPYKRFIFMSGVIALGLMQYYSLGFAVLGIALQ